MTCRYSGTSWFDVLYTSVRNTPGGINDAARFLTDRRGKTIHPETLRAKLRHINGESISLEMVELLTEWMEEKAQPHRLDWLQSLNARFGLIASVAPAEGSAQDLQGSFVNKAVTFGELATTISTSLADGTITSCEAEKIISAAQNSQRSSQEIIEAAKRALVKGV